MELSSLSIVIPTFNDQNTIRSVIRKTVKCVHTVTSDAQILVCNDSSTDDTGIILTSLSGSVKELSIITHDRNHGYGKTIKELYKKANKDWIFSLPGDLQIDPIEINKLIPYTKKHDIILGKREKRSDTVFRFFQSRIYNILLRVIFGISVSDANTVRLMKKSVIHTVSLTTDSAFVDAELLIEAKKHGYKILEIPIGHSKRVSGIGTGGNFTKTILPTILDMIRYKLSNV